MGQIKNIKLHIVTDIKYKTNKKNNMAYRHRVKAPLHQARVFLPQWFVKVFRPNSSIPQEDRIQLHVPTDMGKVDIRNYLQQIYNIPVEKVHTEIRRGWYEKIQCGNEVIFKKRADYKVAYVFLREGHTFKYPDVFPPLFTKEMEELDMSQGPEKEEEPPQKDYSKGWLGLD